MTTTLADAVAVVAGGTGALGRAVTLAFLGVGAKVSVTYRRSEELESVRQAAGAAAARLEGHPTDVTDEASVRGLIERVRAQHTRVDVLVNTVGAYFGGVPLWESDTRRLEQLLAVNLRSGFLLARAVVPVMLAQRQGAIVNVAARAAVQPGAGQAAYAASKAAALAMVDSLAADLVGTGVRVNSVLPSIIDTAANRDAMPGANVSHWVGPEDIARVILFLCSEDAKAIHGAAIPVYGS